MLRRRNTGLLRLRRWFSEHRVYSICNCYNCSSNSGYNCTNNWWINFTGNGLLNWWISGFVSVLGSIADLCCIYRCSGCDGTTSNDWSGCDGTTSNDWSGCDGTTSSWIWWLVLSRGV